MLEMRFLVVPKWSMLEQSLGVAGIDAAEIVCYYACSLMNFSGIALEGYQLRKVSLSELELRS